MDFPDELLLYIFSRLTKVCDKLSVTRVSQQWRRVGLDDSLWRGCSLDLRDAILLSRLNNTVPLRIQCGLDEANLDALLENASHVLGWSVTMTQNRVTNLVVFDEDGGALGEVRYGGEFCRRFAPRTSTMHMRRLQRLFALTGVQNVSSLDLSDSSCSCFYAILGTGQVTFPALRQLTIGINDRQRASRYFYGLLNRLPLLESLRILDDRVFGEEMETQARVDEHEFPKSQLPFALRTLEYDGDWYAHHPQLAGNAHLFPNLEEICTNCGSVSFILGPFDSVESPTVLARLRRLSALMDGRREPPLPCALLEELQLRFSGRFAYECCWALEPVSAQREVWPRLSRLAVTIHATTDVEAIHGACASLLRVPFEPSPLIRDTRCEVSLRLCEPNTEDVRYEENYSQLHDAVVPVMQALAAEHGLPLVTRHLAIGEERMLELSIQRA